MLCYRCGSHVPDESVICPVCNANLTSKKRPTASVPESYFGLEAVSSRAVSMLDVGEVLKERYRVGALVGPGPVGAVFSGRDIVLDNKVALKVFAPNLVQDEEDRKQIRQRFKKLSQTEHPNVATLYDLVESGPRILIVSEFIEGVTLRQVIAARKAEKKVFSFQEIVPILEQICIGLAAYTNIAHGALKPENIFIIPEGIKLTDFNLPLCLPLKPYIAMQRHVANAEGYFAPEIREGHAEFDRRADVYSLAVIATEMLTGIVYTGKDGWAPSNENSSITVDIDAVLLKSLNSSPHGRYRSPLDFFNSLAAVINDAVELPPASYRKKIDASPFDEFGPPTKPDADMPPPPPMEDLEEGIEDLYPAEDEPEKPSMPSSKGGEGAKAEGVEEVGVEEEGIEEHEEIPPPPPPEDLPFEGGEEALDLPEDIPPPPPEPGEEKKAAHKDLPPPKPPKDPPPPFVSTPESQDAKTELYEPIYHQMKPAKRRNILPPLVGGAMVIVGVVVAAIIVSQRGEKPEVSGKLIEEQVRQLQTQIAQKEGKQEAEQKPVINQETASKEEAKPQEEAAQKGEAPVVAAKEEEKPQEEKEVEKPSKDKDSRAERLEPSKAAKASEAKASAAKGRETPPPAASSPPPAPPPYTPPSASAPSAQASAPATPPSAPASSDPWEAWETKKDTGASSVAAAPQAPPAYSPPPYQPPVKGYQPPPAAPPPSAPPSAPAPAAAPPPPQPSQAQASAPPPPPPPPPKCPSGMQFIKGTTFTFGLPSNSPYRGFDDLPNKKVTVSDFCVDYFEYPNARGSMPKVNVNHSQAQGFCKKLGKRLCSEAEWEFACKGSSNLTFPYGHQFDPNACVTDDVNGNHRKVAPAGRFPKCRGAFGTSDMSGNVAEWVEEGVTKGGAANRPNWAVTCSSRAPVSKARRSDDIGFRCCADPQN